MINGKKIRVLTPRTTNGVQLMYDDNRQVVFKETIAPKSAEQHLRRENEEFKITGRPELCHEIEDFQEEIPVYTGRQKTAEDLRAELKAEILAELRGETNAPAQTQVPDLMPAAAKAAPVQQSEPAKRSHKKQPEPVRDLTEATVTEDI
jgi:hypothetical protein